MNNEWEIKLQEEFPFLKQNNEEEEQNIYRRWGFECSGGWAKLLRECCEAIVARYAEDGIEPDDIDFVPEQIKEKFGTLRFYYGYINAPCGVAAFDLLGSGTSLRFEPSDEVDDEKTRKLRHDISQIVRAAEEKSKHTCEICGEPGALRNDRDIGIFYVRTLCDSCHEKRIKSVEEAKGKRTEKAKEIYDEIKKGSDKQLP